MKQTIIKLMMVIAIAASIVGCGNTRKVANGNNGVVSGALYGYEQIINNRQLDSICTVDVLPRDLSSWSKSSFTDYETQKRLTKMMYIKHLDSKSETIYILVPKDTLYKITKRIGYSE